MRAKHLAKILPILVFAALAAYAQDQPPAPAAPAAGVLTRSDIDQRIQQTEDNKALDQNIKSQIIETYGQALQELQTATDWRKRSADSIALRTNAPETIRDLEEQAAQPLPPPTATPNQQTTSLDTMAAMLAEAERKLEAANAALAAVQQQAGARTSRRTQLDTLIASARNAIDLAKATGVPSAKATPEEVEALRIYTLARTQALEAEIAAYNEEIANFEVLGRLLTLQQDVAQRDVAIAQQDVGPLQKIVSDERLNDAQRALNDAHQAVLDAGQAPPAIRSSVEQLARENEEIARHRAEPDSPQAKLGKISDDSKKIQAEVQRVTDEKARVKTRERTIGLTGAVGTLLRTNRENLPSRRTLAASIRVREKAIDQALLRQIELQESRDNLSADAVNRRIDEILTIVNSAEDITRAQLEQYREQLAALFTTQRRLLDALISEHDTYLNALMAQNGKEKQLLEQRNDFEDYINQRVLWVASGDVISMADVKHSRDALQWLFDWHKWMDVVATLGRDLRDAPIPNSIAVALALSTLLLYPRIRRRMNTLADTAEKRSAVSYYPTLETLCHSILLASIGPLIALYLGWRLSSSLTASEFTHVFGSALIVLAAMYASLELPREFLRPRGLGEIHFEWPDDATAAARRALSWAMPIGLPLLLTIALVNAPEAGRWRESVGRLIFAALMLIWATMGHQLTKRNAPSVTIYLPLSIPGHRDRLRRVFYLLSAGAPVSFAIASMAGYFDTSQRLALRVHMTLILMFSISVCVGLGMRALLLARRRLAIEQAKKKRAELREAQKKTAEGVEITSTPDFQTPELDLDAIDTQTRRLTRSAAIIAISVGLWFIWVDFIPALRVLDQITIGDTTAPIKAAAELPVGMGSGTTAATSVGNGAAPAPAAVASTSSSALPSSEALVGAVESLTYADLLFSFIMFLLTVSAARNLPGLIEIALLQRLDLARGERYAIKTVLGYIIGVVGATFVLSILGIRWERMQWLVAALGLGIGFGLQEIVANFISGLIILFERPIRLGDTVTVDGISGTVTRIQIRATTITDGEKRDLIVPNKEFVTGKVMNWTLTDTVIRMTVSIGVDYNSDTHKVSDILARVAQQNSRVLKDPGPSVMFTTLAAGTLSFDVQVYVSTVEQITPCRDELLHAIIDALRAADIKIAFNQTDIHLRNAPELLALSGAAAPKAIEQK